MSGKSAKLARRPQGVGTLKDISDQIGSIKSSIKKPFAVFQSHGFAAFLYRDTNGFIRMSVNRLGMKNGEGAGSRTRWEDGITWDQLQEIKSQVGFAEHWMVEVYPPDSEVVNVANIRHLFLLSEAPPYAWVGGSE